MDSKRGRWQFSLGALLGIVLACALILGVIINATTQYEVTIRCRQLPANDQALRNWFQSQDGVEHLTISRDENLVHIRFLQYKLLWSYESLAPPLGALGYSSVEKISISASNHGVIGGISFLCSHCHAFPRRR